MISIDVSKKLTGSTGELNLEVNLQIQEGEFVTLFGSSGSGKTTALRMIAGLLTPDKGSIEINGLEWFNANTKTKLKTQQRDVGLVFQDHALFPNMTVFENIVYACPNEKAKTQINELLEVMELSNLQNQKPLLLSGGQKQRVALARTLIRKPKLLLLDEPLTALETSLRIKIQDYLSLFHKENKMTTILVSHDYFDIIRLSSKVFILENGKITKSGSPREVLPLNEFRDAINSYF